MSGRVLITGASSGLGRQLAMDYRQAGWQVWGCGRDGERLCLHRRACSNFSAGAPGSGTPAAAKYRAADRGA